MERIVLYSRVSRDDMNCENQKKILLENLSRYGFTDYEYFQEEMSSRKTRPVKDMIIRRFRKGDFNVIMVVRIDRWARSLQELTMDVKEIVDKNGRFIAILNGFDFQKTNFNASQQLMLNLFASFADFEREIIRERTLEGLDRAKAWGKKLGRPKGSKDKNKRKIKPPLEKSFSDFGDSLYNQRINTTRENRTFITGIN
jgi:DNA invertase Pin-like site-specific DNA recombinase